MAKQYFETVTPEATLVFPKLFTPESFDGVGEPKYSCILVFPKGSDLTGVKNIIKQAFDERFPKGASNARMPLCDGNEKAEVWGSVFKDATYIRLNTKMKPAVVDSDRNFLNENEVYGGMIVRAVINAYSYDRTGNRGVNLSVSAIQVVGAGEKLGYDSSMSVNKFDKIEGGFKANDPFADAL